MIRFYHCSVISRSPTCPVTLWSALKSRRTSTVCPFSTETFVEKSTAGVLPRSAKVCSPGLTPSGRMGAVPTALSSRSTLAATLVRNASVPPSTSARCKLLCSPPATAISARASTKPGADTLILWRAPGATKVSVAGADRAHRVRASRFGVDGERRRAARAPVDVDERARRIGLDVQRRRRRTAQVGQRRQPHGEEEQEHGEGHHRRQERARARRRR